MSIEEYEKYIYNNFSKTWERQQKTTFTAWCNAHLRKADMRIDSFEHDFRNGLKLMKLLEIISGESLPVPDKGRMRFHKIANVNKALKFIENKGVKLASIGAEEIVDGNVKMTLGMIWTIILRFTIQDIYVEDSSAKEGLLLWCKRRTNSYNNIEIKNFKTSFQNGLGFCALIHSHDSSLLDYSCCSPLKPRKNLELAFKIAEKHLDIPQMLSAEEMAINSESDERSIMAYVSSYYHTFTKKDKMNKAIDDIKDIIESKINEDQLENSTNKLTNHLKYWLEEVIAKFKDQSLLSNKNELEANLSYMDDFFDDKKPYHSSCLCKLNFIHAHQQNLSTNEKKKNNSQELANLSDKWQLMESLSLKYQIYLSEERRRLYQLDNLVERFRIIHNELTTWMSSSKASLQSHDYLNLFKQQRDSFSSHDLVCQLRLLQRQQNGFLALLGSHQTQVEALVSIAAELRRLKYRDISTIDSKLSNITESWDSMGQLHHTRLNNITKYHGLASELDDLYMDFANRSQPLYNWIIQSSDQLDDRFILQFVDEIKELITAHDSFKLSLSDAASEYQAVMGLCDSVDGIINQTNVSIRQHLHHHNNQYELSSSTNEFRCPINAYCSSSINRNKLEMCWQQLQQSIINREQFLQTHLQRQMTERQLRHDYNSACLEIKSQLDKLTNQHHQALLLDNSTGLSTSPSSNKHHLKSYEDIERQLAYVHSLAKKLSECCSSIEADEVITVHVQELMCLHKTTQQLISDTNSPAGSSDHAISSSTAPGTTPHKDYRECFDYFDKQQTGRLDCRQFHACLLSLGFDLDSDKDNDVKFREITDKVDPSSTGYVTYESFIDFILLQNTANQNKDRREKLQMALQSLVNTQQVYSTYQLMEILRVNLPAHIYQYCLGKVEIDHQPQHINKAATSTTSTSSPALSIGPNGDCVDHSTFNIDLVISRILQ